MNNRIQEMIEQRLEREGWTAKGWRDGDDGLEAIVGRFVVIEEDESSSLYDGCEGELTACVVGAKEHGNERVAFSFREDEMDGSVEVRDLSALDPVL